MAVNLADLVFNMQRGGKIGSPPSRWAEIGRSRGAIIEFNTLLTSFIISALRAVWGL